VIVAKALGLALFSLVMATSMRGQGSELRLPDKLVAGESFSIPTEGSGKAVLYVAGPGQALRQEVQLGSPAMVQTGVLFSAGHYVVALVGGSSVMSGELDVVPAKKVEVLGFLAKPSRLPVGLHNGISGAIYIFDAYNNLIVTPTPATFELSNLTGGASQNRTVTTRNGLAWIEMDSAAKEGRARFVARSGTASSTRVIEQVPGDPCRINITARQNGKQIEVQTAPVRDCTGNAVPDGTIVTFTQAFNGTLTTVDAPLKEGIAKVNMPAHSDSRISAASGVVAGNEIRWAGGSR
jgi:hypothetical protein